MRKLLLVAAVAVPLFADMPSLDWMAGCWTMQSGATRIDEQWSRPAAGMMLGMSRTIKQERTVFHEFMRIEIQDGTPSFTPRIGIPMAPVSFRAIKQTANEVVFENLTHDFPQRVMYRRDGDALFARIEGSKNGADRHEDFPMKRVSCEGR